jgi:uncharacterized membrane protein YeaQ/YmgE (transglycosylase-associated protein family)
MSILWFLLIGAAAGWLAGKMVKGRGFGLAENLVVGILGAVVGGVVFGLLGVNTSGPIGELLAATAGAVILLVVLKAIRKA